MSNKNLATELATKRDFGKGEGVINIPFKRRYSCNLVVYMV